MALFGKKNEGQGMPPDMGMPDQYSQQGEYSQEEYPPEQYPPEDYSQEQYAQPTGGAPNQSYQTDKQMIEEIAEAIVEEKWAEKKKEIDKVAEWKENVASTLIQLQQQIDDVKASFDSMQKAMLGKISEYDENLTNVGTEIKAMEKVFSKVLPSLTESVNKLGRISAVRKK